MKKKIFTLIVGLSFVACNAMAITTVSEETYNYADTWVNWPDYTSNLGDENGTPKISSMDVKIGTTAGGESFLNSITINLHDSTYRQAYDSLFISTDGAWDSWDYFVHDGGTTNAAYTSGTVADDGLYSVNSNFDYTYVIMKNRIGNPNGIDAGTDEFGNLSSLTLLDGSFGASQSGYSILYDFSAKNIAIDIDSFFIAYAPWCDNDIIGGGTAPVPEPATLILLGSGLAGLAFYRRKKK